MTKRLVMEDFRGPIMPWYAKAGLLALLIIMLFISSCTVLTSLDDADEARAETESIKAQMEADKANYKAKMELEAARLQTLERLVSEHNYGPMSARCAVEGWSGQYDREACERANSLHEASRTR